jgi:hypothetical protein
MEPIHHYLIELQRHAEEVAANPGECPGIIARHWHGWHDPPLRNMMSAIRSHPSETRTVKRSQMNVVAPGRMRGVCQIPAADDENVPLP